MPLHIVRNDIAKMKVDAIVNAAGHRWLGGQHGARENRISCYRTSLSLAKITGCESVAFSLISSGIYGYPKDQALRIATDTTSEFLPRNDMTVYIVTFAKKAYQISGKLFQDML